MNITQKKPLGRPANTRKIMNNELKNMMFNMKSSRVAKITKHNGTHQTITTNNNGRRNQNSANGRNKTRNNRQLTINTRNKVLNNSRSSTDYEKNKQDMNKMIEKNKQDMNKMIEENFSKIELIRFNVSKGYYTIINNELHPFQNFIKNVVLTRIMKPITGIQPDYVYNTVDIRTMRYHIFKSDKNIQKINEFFYDFADKMYFYNIDVYKKLGIGEKTQIYQNAKRFIDEHTKFVKIVNDNKARVIDELRENISTDFVESELKRYYSIEKEIFTLLKDRKEPPIQEIIRKRMYSRMNLTGTTKKELEKLRSLVVDVNTKIKEMNTLIKNLREWINNAVGSNTERIEELIRTSKIKEEKDHVILYIKIIILCDSVNHLRRIENKVSMFVLFKLFKEGINEENYLSDYNSYNKYHPLFIKTFQNFKTLFNEKKQEDSTIFYEKTGIKGVIDSIKTYGQGSVEDYKDYKNYESYISNVISNIQNYTIKPIIKDAHHYKAYSLTEGIQIPVEVDEFIKILLVDYPMNYHYCCLDALKDINTIDYPFNECTLSDVCIGSKNIIMTNFSDEKELSKRVKYNKIPDIKKRFNIVNKLCEIKKTINKYIYILFSDNIEDVINHLKHMYTNLRFKIDEYNGMFYLITSNENNLMYFIQQLYIILSKKMTILKSEKNRQLIEIKNIILNIINKIIQDIDNIEPASETKKIIEDVFTRTLKYMKMKMEILPITNDLHTEYNEKYSYNVYKIEREPQEFEIKKNPNGSTDYKETLRELGGVTIADLLLAS